MLLFQIPGKEVLLPQVYRCMDFKEDIKQYFLSKRNKVNATT